MTPSLNIDIHGLIEIRIDGAPEAIFSRVSSEYAYFLVDDEPSTPDVVVDFSLPRDWSAPKATVQAGHSGTVAATDSGEFWLCCFCGVFCCFFYALTDVRASAVNSLPCSTSEARTSVSA